MSRTAAVTLFQLLVACLALAVDETPAGSDSSANRSREFEVTVRSLTETVRVLSDNHGGWRMERYYSGHTYLVEAEDSFGPLLEVTRGIDGRVTGVLLAKRYAVEYFYPGAGAAWTSKVLYEPRSGDVLAHVVNTRPSPGDGSPYPACTATLRAAERLYAVVPFAGGDAVVRSIEIDDPARGGLLDRFDYTATHIIVHLGDGGGDLPRLVAIPRNLQDVSKPHIVEISEPAVARYDVVWSLAGRSNATPVSKPHLKGALAPAVEAALRDAFPLALRKVREVPECRALFENFLTSGNRVLSNSLYASPGRVGMEESCGNGAAYTHVRSPITRLCPGFAELDRARAAVVLIHEALHFAGLGEAPFYSNAPTSGQINRLVQEKCGF